MPQAIIKIAVKAWFIMQCVIGTALLFLAIGGLVWTFVGLAQHFELQAIEQRKSDATSNH